MAELTKVQERSIFFDVVKGIAIFIVVLGHSFQLYSEEWTRDPYVLGMIMFNMPLFMTVSGYFIVPSITKQRFRDYFKKKAYQLLLPSITYGVIVASTIVCKNLTTSQNTNWNEISLLCFHGLWYLLSFFIISMFSYIVHSKFKTEVSSMAIWLISCILVQFLPSDLMLNGVKLLMPFTMGAILFRHFSWDKIPWFVAMSALISFIWAHYHFHFEDSMYAKPNTALSFNYWQSFFLRIVAGVSGTVITLYAARYLQYIALFQKYLSTLGRNTLPIYVIQSYIFYYLMFLHIKLPIYSLLILITFVIIAICMVVSHIIKRNTRLKLFILGQR